MEWIASMPGPTFLGLYAVVIVITLIGAWLVIRSDPDDGLEPLVPAYPDPYEVAYLRGGEPEVGRLAVIDLTDSGYLRESKVKGRGGKSRLKASSKKPDSRVPPALRAVVSLFDAHNEPLEKMLRLPEFRKAAAAIAEPFAARYDRQFLVLESRRWAVRAFGLLAIAGLGGYKLYVALEKGRTNVLFLCFMALIAVTTLWSVTKPRLNAAGRAFLKKVQTAYRDLKTKPKIDVRPLQHADLLLVVGLFGAPILLGGPDIRYAEMLGRSAMRDSGMTGGSCSSCGSSDGGGDGGCGGGCGGCGGD